MVWRKKFWKGIGVDLEERTNAAIEDGKLVLTADAKHLKLFFYDLGPVEESGVNYSIQMTIEDVRKGRLDDKPDSFSYGRVELDDDGHVQLYDAKGNKLKHGTGSKTAAPNYEEIRGDDNPKVVESRIGSAYRHIVGAYERHLFKILAGQVVELDTLRIHTGRRDGWLTVSDSEHKFRLEGKLKGGKWTTETIHVTSNPGSDTERVIMDWDKVSQYHGKLFTGRDLFEDFAVKGKGAVSKYGIHTE